MSSLPAACTIAARFLRHPQPDEADALASHLESCATCSSYYSTNEGAFIRILDEDPLGPLAALAQDANHRVRANSKGHTPHTLEFWWVPGIPGYELLEQIGHSKLSQVFIATQRSLHRRVAIKVIRCWSPGKETPSAAAEAQVLADVKHPNIVTIHETGLWEEGIWMALEYCPGGSLQHRLEREKPLDELEAARLMARVCRGVQAAHEAGIIHRDIKPGNILLDEVGEPKLSDFGFALPAESREDDPTVNAPVGTPAYMAPEQARGEELDFRADVCALGGVLYHLLTGRPPFRSAGSFEALIMAAHGTPVPPHLLNPRLSKDLGQICAKSIAREPAARYQSARHMARDLERFLQGQPVEARPLGPLDTAWHWMTHHKLLASSLVLTALLLVGSLAGFASLSVWALGERALAEANGQRAIKLLEMSERDAYAGKIQRANVDWKFGFFDTARSLTESCPYHRRGWEHHYLTTRNNRSQITLASHKDKVHAVVASPDGAWIASGGQDGLIRFWSTATGEAFRPPITLEKRIVGLTLSADGGTLVAGTQNGVLLAFDLRGDQAHQPLQSSPQRNPYRWMGETFEVSPDGGRIYSQAAESSQVVVWDTRSAKELARWEKGHDGPIRVMRLNSAGTLLATGSGDSDIALWDTASGKRLQKLKGHTGAVRDLTFSADGRRLFSASQDRTVRQWNPDTGEAVRTYAGGHTDWVNTVALSGDGKLLASAGDDLVIQIWDAQTGKILRKLKGHGKSVRRAVFTKGSNLLATASWDGTVKLWNPEMDQSPPVLPHPREVSCAQYSPDGTLLATGCSDGIIRLWDTPTATVKRELKGHARLVLDVAMDPSGGILASTGNDRKILLWDLGKGTLLTTLKNNGTAVAKLAHLPGGDLLLGINNNGRILVWNTKSFRLERVLEDKAQGVYALAVSPDGRYFATGGADRIVRVWNSATWEVEREFQGHTEFIRDMAFHPSKRLLVSAAMDSSLVLWDLDTGERLRRLEGHESGVAEVVFSPDGKRIASSGLDRTVRIWDPEDGHELLTLNGLHDNSVRKIVFRPDGNQLASASDDGKVILWDAVQRLESQTLGGAITLVADVSFLGGDDTLAIRDTQGTIRYWNIDQERVVGKPAKIPDWEVWARPRLESLDGRWGVEIRNGNLLLIDRQLRQERRQQDQRTLERWQKKASQPSSQPGPDRAPLAP